MNEEITNIGLAELADIENLSVRTCNICEYHDLLNLDDILQYFRKHGNFKRIRNCGDQSNQELLIVCKKYDLLEIYTKKIREQKKAKYALIQIISNLTIRQKAILDNLLTSKYKSLSIKNVGVLITYFNNQITLKGFNEAFLSKSYINILNIEKVGKKFEKEISIFLKEIKEIIEKIIFFYNDEELNREMINAFLINQFSIDRETMIEIGKNYDFSKGIPVFKTIYILIERNYIFNEKEKTVFYHSLCFSKNTEIEPLRKTGNRLGITNERARQIRNKILDNFNQYFSFLSFFEKDNLNFYNLDTSSSLLNVDQSFLDELLKIETVQYNIFFINRILSIILKDKYDLIGNEERTVLNKERKECYNYKSTYLISKHIHLIFDFEKMIDDVYHRLSVKIAKDYKFHFQSYLLSFQKADCFEYLDKIAQISEQLLVSEFGVAIDFKDNITFIRNIPKTVTEYINDTLIEANKPLTVKEIFDVLNQQYPGVVKDVNAVKSHCQRNSQLINLGRSSTFGLKSWKSTHENIKGGTMHDISEEYLSVYDTPKHIDEITEYVGIYRKNISSKKLKLNLKSAEYRRFRFFEDNYIGLVSKTYDASYLPVTPVNNSNSKYWEETFKKLIVFTTRNGYLPLSNGPKEEIKLYRFLHAQERKLDTLNEHQKGKVKNFLMKYNSYKALKTFVIENKRFPIAQILEERNLCNFFNRQRKLLQDGQMPKEYLDRLQEIIELVNSDKKNENLEF